MNRSDPTAEQMAKIVLEVYTYALDHTMDITSPGDVKKMLEALNLETPDNISIDVLIQGLIAFHKLSKANVAQLKNERKKIPN